MYSAFCVNVLNHHQQPNHVKNVRNVMKYTFYTMHCFTEQIFASICALEDPI